MGGASSKEPEVPKVHSLFQLGQISKHNVGSACTVLVSTYVFYFIHKEIKES